MREKAAALLKVAAGQSPHAVAKQGVLKTRDPDTVYRWLNRYLGGGIDGWLVKPGEAARQLFPRTGAMKAHQAVVRTFAATRTCSAMLVIVGHLARDCRPVRLVAGHAPGERGVCWPGWALVTNERAITFTAPTRTIG
ncbi:MAG: hypothetical protein IPH95_10955 [Candidatus Promineofilum sp.]|nr:hypothetical protein [Promineifilum sp.]